MPAASLSADLAASAAPLLSFQPATPEIGSVDQPLCTLPASPYLAVSRLK